MSVQITGFDELLQLLAHVPEGLRKEGMEIVREETEGAAIEIAQAYPQKTGTLSSRVVTQYPSSTSLVGIVRSTAPHAHIWEFGTKDRYTGSKRVRTKGVETGRRDTGGAKAFRGRMPAHKDRPGKVTPAIAQRRRERMFRRLVEMVRRAGFQVGD